MSVEDTIRETASYYGVPPDLALAVAWRESQYNQAARGTSGEVGIFQLMPLTAQELQVNPYDTQQNIDGGIRYLRKMYDRFGTWEDALAAYNAGASRVEAGTVPPSTKSYIASIFSLFSPSSSEVSPVAEPGQGEWDLASSLPGVPGGLSALQIIMILAGVAIVGILVADRG